MSHGMKALFWLLVAGVLMSLASGLFTVNETEYAILTQFGKPVGEPLVSPGLKWKTPFVQEVNRLDKRFMEWDGAPVAIPTKDKTYIRVAMFARWRISDPKIYFVRLHDERSAQSRLEDILGSETRNAVARHELIEIVRTDRDRKPVRDDLLSKGGLGSIGTLPPIHYGRRLVEADIAKAAAKKLSEFGIELLDVRVKRVNYNPEVLDRIYQRMISERGQIAQRFRSEGEGEAAKIAGKKERDLNEIQSEAYRKVQELRGEADAKASEIYARAYNQSPDAAEFYAFVKGLETYQKIFSKDSTLLLSTDSSLLKLLKTSVPSLPAPHSSPPPPPPPPHPGSR